MPRALIVLAACLVVLGGGLLAMAEDADIARKADALFKDKNYAEAAVAYGELLTSGLEPAAMRHASLRRVACFLRLERYDDALEAAEGMLERVEGTPHEARAQRFLGNLYVNLPHWGVRAGGVFYRAQWRDGIHLQSHRHDKRLALEHLERARELYAYYDDPDHTDRLASLTEPERAAWHDERIECSFDLSGAVARFGIYEPEYQFWYGFWGERDDALAETAGEDDFDEGMDWYAMSRVRPRGLRLTVEGEPVFPTTPATYASSSSDDGKILFLLQEVRDLDRTEEKQHTATSLYRQAMLARTRFGMDRVRTLAGLYNPGTGQPLQEELETFEPWTLADDEAIVLAGGRLRRVTLPPTWNVLELLHVVEGDYPLSGMAPQAGYAAGLYLQSRQQYVQATQAYEAMIQQHPTSAWATHARVKVTDIRQPQVTVNTSGVQLPGAPAAIQLTHRNTTKAYFVARRIDLVGFLEEIRQRKPDPENGYPHWWALGNWSNYFVNGIQDHDGAYAIAARHVGQEVGRWTESLVDDGTHRLVQRTLPSPLTEAGAYLVYAYLEEPPREDERLKGGDVLRLGVARAVLAMTDLALVEKRSRKGTLYFVSDARTGAPVAGADLHMVETWSRWDGNRRKSDYFRDERRATTDARGLALDPVPSRQLGQVHTLATVTAAGKRRVAWTGMRYWQPYHPSRMQNGLYAYCVTDRPVYRPEQTVRFKAWLRQGRNGLLENFPGRSVTVTVFDPKGSPVLKKPFRTDDYGGLDGTLELDEEPPLGLYRIQIQGERYAGGQSFRVEEYKKPEFEVTVEPSTTHARLGDRLTANIKATYYFGAPVSEADVSVRVFRETYRHQSYPHGVWDWLYGAGYGYGWYPHAWFSWWGDGCVGCFAPAWWHGFRGGGAPTPVRELVLETKGRIQEDGTFPVTVDTSAALEHHGDQDHRYVIQAEVRDASRRVIEGEGAVKVTRQAFYASLHADRGWTRPAEEFVLKVQCQTPDGQPVETKGILHVAEVSFGGRDDGAMLKREIEQITLQTDERGQADVRFSHDKSGQLEFTFEAPDAWGQVVRGHALVWVVGDDFDGAFHRFNDLELLTDRRTYQPGDVARVMVNVRRKGAWVLFGDRVDSGALLSWQVLHIPGRSRVVEVPIHAGDAPNIFVEALTVAEAKVHERVQRICVPPEDGVLAVDVQTDKAEYEPGERATVSVRATRPDGSPAKAQVTLSAFDRSVLYIQPELTPRITGFFHGRLRHHNASHQSNLLERFAAQGHVSRPFQELWPQPPSWYGIWGPSADASRAFVQGDTRELLGAWGAEEALGEDMETADGGVTADACAPCTPAAATAISGAPGGARRGFVARDDSEKLGMAREQGAAAPGGADLVEAEVRTRFADTALWATAIETADDGTASALIDMPDNLTTWKVNAWCMTKDTRVGQATTSAVTTKNLLVRLQAPRFFMEYDEVVLSANVHNYLDEAKQARVTLTVPDALLALMGDVPATVDVSVPAGGESRVDWRVKVLEEGQAAIRVEALTDEESDAMQVTFPVLVHGMSKQVATTGSIRPSDPDKSLRFEFEVPDKRRPELTVLEVRYAPSLVGAMLDALPYCLDYPYGCTEQTMSRFLPAVLTLKTLQAMGLELEDLESIREGRMAELRRIAKDEHFTLPAAYVDSPIFDGAALRSIVDKSLKRLASMQQSDGGWGWWTRDASNPYLTSYVLYGLLEAREADVEVPDALIQRGTSFLAAWASTDLRREAWAPDTQQAFVAYVLARAGTRATMAPEKGDDRPGDLIERLWLGRDHLNVYAKSLLSLAMATLDDETRAHTVLQNILQYTEENEETEVAWVRTANQGWWYWWNNDIETNAWALRALVRLDPQNELAPRMVKWLLGNRKHGYYWRSTRDTTLCVAAMSEFVLATGEGNPDFTLRIDLDHGAVVKEVRIHRENFFTFDNRFVVEGLALGGGKHTLTVSRTGEGAVYVNAYLRYFTKEEHIAAAGHELKVERTYYRLKQIEQTVEVPDADGEPVGEKRLRYERVPLAEGDEVASGDLIQVELALTSDNDYTYLACEDMKPAGCEPVELRSGGTRQEGFWANMELRDEKVAFFFGSLGMGRHLIRYRLRAEIPGVFHALPTRLYAMYVPELRANAEEQVIRIVD